jgi:hypothetical protein
MADGAIVVVDVIVDVVVDDEGDDEGDDDDTGCTIVLYISHLVAIKLLVAPMK